MFQYPWELNIATENEPFHSIPYLAEGPDDRAAAAYLDGGVALCATHCLTRTARQYDEHWPMSGSVGCETGEKPWEFNGICHEKRRLNGHFIGYTIKNGDSM